MGLSKGRVGMEPMANGYAVVLDFPSVDLCGRTSGRYRWMGVILADRISSYSLIFDCRALGTLASIEKAETDS